MIRSALYYGVVAGSGMFLLLTILPTVVRSSPTPLPGCPPLPEQGQTNRVSIHIVKALDVPGVVCVRAINGLDEAIGIEALSMKLQKREKKWWWRKGQFRDFKETPPAGILIGTTGGPASLLAGGVFDERLPRLSPASLGTYRVCFRYTLPQMAEKLETCSEEFTLP